MSPTKLRVLVVEDSLTVRRRLCEVLASDPGIVVVGEADNGERAIELCRALRPDVITLDMALPIMTGLSATEYIMAHFPTPILIVSASTNRGDLFQTYDALAAGAVDVLEKPRADDSDGAWNKKFIACVKLVARIKVITHPRARLAQASRGASSSSCLPASAPSAARPDLVTKSKRLSLVALGASTGGPSALVTVLNAIPADLPLTILLVLHIDQAFGSAFAEWLSNQTAHAVRFAVGGEVLTAETSRTLMAPPGRHLVAEGSRLMLNNEPELHSCRPSIDVLFESLARNNATETSAALLTGMGRDGAQGLLSLRRAGALTFTQDEESCVVYGMPREAALLGAANRVLPLAAIGPAIAQAISSRASRYT